MAYEFESAIALIIPFILGFIIGYILKHLIKILGAITILIVLLLLLGYIQPAFLEGIFRDVLNYGNKAIEAARTVSSILPVSSLLFIFGVAVGYLISK